MSHSVTPAPAPETPGFYSLLQTGTARRVNGSKPVALDDGTAAWLVVHGIVNVFAVQTLQRGEGYATGPREFLYRVDTGHLLFGYAPSTETADIALVAVGETDTVLAPVSREALLEAMELAPAPTELLFAAYAQRVRDALPIEATETIPEDTSDDDTWAWLGRFQHRALRAAAQLLVEREAIVKARLQRRAHIDRRVTARAITAMGTLLSRSANAPVASSASPLDDALGAIGSAQGITFRVRPPRTRSDDRTDLAEEARALALASGVGCRQVRLESGWWRKDAGPLLAFSNPSAPVEQNAAAPHEPEHPLVLLPTERGGYEVVNPVTGTRMPASEALAAGLAPFALQFYRGFPNHAVRARDIVQFMLAELRHDGRAIVRTSLAASILALAPPLLTRSLFDQVLPGADSTALTTVLMALVISGISALLFECVRAVAVMRVRTRLIHDLQLALLDRLFRLPVSFFRQYSAGDLGRRALGVMTFGKDVGQSTLTTLFSAIAGGVSLLLLFWYSVPLALLSTLLFTINAVVAVGLARRALLVAREKERNTGTLSALMLETLCGMAKLRVAAAEWRIMARWAEPFRAQQQAAFRFGMLGAGLSTFQSVFDVVARLALFAVYAALWNDNSAPMSTGAFVAFLAAEGTFRASVATVANTAVDLLEQLPAVERAGPILHAIPESAADLPAPGVLQGHIELRGVTFSYGQSGVNVLNDLSLDIPAGSFVAFVGPSGSGKSTLLRLLLGFEEPTRGSIRYDDHDLRFVDRVAIRRQIGVVLQNATLSQGDIYSNITGSTPRPQAAVWEAARLAGVEDEIRAMPMGLLTLIPDGGASLSGGQRQRLLIARALINRPTMLFFDEATSALDTRAQRHVSESVDALRATRVVIAHRLSTIRHADRIVVLDAGRIVESGTYEELMAREGLFARLAAQQEA